MAAAARVVSSERAREPRGLAGWGWLLDCVPLPAFCELPRERGLHCICFGCGASLSRWRPARASSGPGVVPAAVTLPRGLCGHVHAGRSVAVLDAPWGVFRLRLDLTNDLPHNTTSFHPPAALARSRGEACQLTSTDSAHSREQSRESWEAPGPARRAVAPRRSNAHANQRCSATVPPVTAPRSPAPRCAQRHRPWPRQRRPPPPPPLRAALTPSAFAAP